MKTSRARQELFVVTFIGWIIAANGGHWLITPITHPEAGVFRYAAVWAQIFAGLALTIWARRKFRALTAAAGELS
jgi:hypothetical protein